MRKAKALPLDQVPAVPDHVRGIPSGTGGDVIYDDGVHRWRFNKDNVLLYYIRYTSDRRDRQEAVYSTRR